MIANLTLSLPIPNDFASTRTSSGAVDPPMLQRIRLLSLARGLDGSVLSPERLAWVLLWTKAMSAGDSCSAALDLPDRLATAAANRFAIESLVHARSIVEPLLAEARMRTHFGTTSGPRPSEATWEQTLSRLRAYVVWGLHQDLGSLRQQITLLRDTYDPKPAEDLQKDPAQLALHEALHGPLRSPSKEELDGAMDRHRKALNRQVDQINGWLSDPLLLPWSQHPALQNRMISATARWFSLIGVDEASIRSQLLAAELRLVSGWYAETSNFIHGSTTMNLLLVDDAAVLPRIRDPETADRYARAAAVSIDHLVLILALLKGHLWDGTPGTPHGP